MVDSDPKCAGQPGSRWREFIGARSLGDSREARAWRRRALWLTRCRRRVEKALPISVESFRAMSRILYVDGFNFYYGVTAYWSRETQGRLAGLGWCDFHALIERNFPGPGELRIKYFTAPVTENVELRRHRPGEHGRYSLWRRALQTTPGLAVMEGFYKRTGNRTGPGPAEGREEKQTDVNLAVEVMIDACGPANSRPRHVFLLSGDCDQIPVVFALEERLPVSLSVTVLLPSSHNEGDWRRSYERTRGRLLKNLAAEKRGRTSAPGISVQVKVLDEATLANSLLRYDLRDSDGAFDCPPYWRLPSEYLEQRCRKPEWRPA